MPRCWPSWRRMAAPPRSPCGRSSPPRPSHAPPPMMRRSPIGSPSKLADPAPAFRAVGGRLAEALALWREPAPERGLLSRRRAKTVRRRHRAAEAGQAALLQQYQRYRRRLRMCRRVRPGARRRLRDRQACQSVRRGRGRKSARGLSQGAGLRPRLRLRRHRGVQPSARCGRSPRRHRDLHRSHHRARRQRGGDRGSSAPKRICGCWWPAACPIRARRASSSSRWPAAFLPSRATMRWSTRCNCAP